GVREDAPEPRDRRARHAEQEVTDRPDDFADHDEAAVGQNVVRADDGAGEGVLDREEPVLGRARAHGFADVPELPARERDGAVAEEFEDRLLAERARLALERDARTGAARLARRATGRRRGRQRIGRNAHPCLLDENEKGPRDHPRAGSVRWSWRASGAQSSTRLAARGAGREAKEKVGERQDRVHILPITSTPGACQGARRDPGPAPPGARRARVLPWAGHRRPHRPRRRGHLFDGGKMRLTALLLTGAAALAAAPSLDAQDAPLTARADLIDQAGRRVGEAMLVETPNSGVLIRL